MNQRAQYLIQILEKIGAPLLGAVADVSARVEKINAKDQDDLARQDAQRVAELLARSIQISIDLGQKMDLASMPDQGESFRLALAALAGDVVADQYRTIGRLPAEGDVARAVTAFEAVLTFSENFIPSPENIARLQQMRADGRSVDAQQTILQSVQAFLPVINAIGAFPFGQPEKKLIQDVSERLLATMFELTQKIFGNTLDETTRPFAELAILRALAALYAESHKAETRRLMGLSEELRMQQTMNLDPVWAAFETRAAMLEVLSLSLIPGANGQQGAGSKAPSVTPPPVQQAQQTPPPAPPVQQPMQQQSAPAQPPVQKPAIFGGAPTQPPAAPAQPVVAPPPPVSAPPAPPPVPPAAPPAGGNPLAMFAKKPAGETPPPAPPAPPPAAAAPPPSSPEETPPQQPPASGPMSFFKKSDG